MNNQGTPRTFKEQILTALLLFILNASLFMAVSFSVARWFTIGNIGVDDANIFFTYARNFSEGYGLVWTQGGERIEGFTSLLWLIICTLGFIVSAAPEPFLFLLSGLLGAAACAIYLLTLANIPISAKHGTLLDSPSLFSAGVLFLCFPFWLITSPAYLSWTLMSLMDTALWSSLILVTISLTYCRIYLPDSLYSRFLYPLILVCLCLTRPEGLGLVLVSLVCLVFGLHLRVMPWPSIFQTLLIPLLAVAGTMAVLTTGRLIYFGYPLPNTYYAKVGNDLAYNLTQGMNYLFDFVSTFPAGGVAVALGLIVAVVWFARVVRAKEAPSDPQFLQFLTWGGVNSSFFLAGIMIYVVVGGDHFPFSRQYQPFWPCVYMIFASSVLLLFNSVLGSKLKLAAVGIVLLTVAALFTLLPLWNDLSKIRREFSLAELGRGAGETLNDLFPETALPNVGAIAVGGIGFSYRGRIIDLMGINNLEMAHASRLRIGQKNHAAFNKDIFYRQLPDLLIHFGESCGPQIDLAEDLWIIKVLKGLPSEPKFREHYRPIIISSENRFTERHGLCGYAKKSFFDNWSSLETMRPLEEASDPD